MTSRWYATVIKYAAIAKINYQSRFAYLPDVVSELPITMFRLWVKAQFFQATYTATGSHEFDGLTFVQLMWCLMIIECFEASSSEPGVAKLIEEEVKSGMLAYSINKPYAYPLFHYLGFLGSSVPNLFINIAGGLMVMVMTVGVMDISLFGLLVGLMLMFFGYTLHFLIELSIGLLAFWIEDVASISWMYHALMLIFGGAILPLALFPDALKRIAELLPFGQLYYSAAKTMVHFETSYVFAMIKIQFFWLAVGALLAYMIWKRGINNVSISGG